MKTLLLLAALFLPQLACGQAQLPDAPKPHIDKKWLALAISGHAAAAWDTEETLINKRRSTFEERNPLARPFVRLPAPAYRATEQLFSAGSDWISWKMRHSRRKWMRKTWWLPQAIVIENHIRGAIYSHTHR